MKRARAHQREDQEARLVDEEIAFHIDARTRDFVEAGYGQEEAARMAREAFGDVERVRQDCIRIDRGEHPMLHRIHMVVTALLLLAVAGLGWSLYAAHIGHQVARERLMVVQEALVHAQQERAPAAPAAIVYVTGKDVARPGTYQLPSRITLRRMLVSAGMSGQVSEGTVVIRREDGPTLTIDLAGGEDPVLEAGDMITVR